MKNKITPVKVKRGDKELVIDFGDNEDEIVGFGIYQDVVEVVDQKQIF